MVDLMHAISIYEERPDHEYCRPDGWTWMHNLPYEWARPNGNPHRPDYCSRLPISVFWKEISLLIEHWTTSRRAAEMSGWKVLVVWTDDAWTFERPNGITCSLDECSGTLKSSWTLNSGRTICHYVQMDVTLNSSQFIDIDGRPDGFTSSSRCKLLTDERSDSYTMSSIRKHGIRLLWVGICT
jgi:hypothetical protein